MKLTVFVENHAPVTEEELTDAKNRLEDKALIRHYKNLRTLGRSHAKALQEASDSLDVC